MNSATSTAAGAPGSREHREVLTRVLAGLYASLEPTADPASPEDGLAGRMLRASQAYDQLDRPRIGQLLPTRFGKAVPVIAPVIAPDERCAGTAD